MQECLAEYRKRAQERSKKDAVIRESTSYKRVVGILSGLGFLVAPGVKPLRSSKVRLKEAISIGISVEPRVLEVLPAAVLSYPKTFLHQEEAPEVFKAVLAALKAHRLGPDFEGIAFEKFYEAANRPSKGKKRKTISKRKVSKTFRLSPDVIEKMTAEAARQRMSNTEYLEMIVRNAALREPHDQKNG